MRFARCCGRPTGHILSDLTQFDHFHSFLLLTPELLTPELLTPVFPLPFSRLISISASIGERFGIANAIVLAKAAKKAMCDQAKRAQCR